MTINSYFLKKLSVILMLLILLSFCLVSMHSYSKGVSDEKIVLKDGIYREYYEGRYFYVLYANGKPVNFILDK